MLISPLYKKSESISDKIPLEIGISCLFHGRIYTPTLMTLDFFKKHQKIHKNLLKFALNYDKLSNSLYLRSRQPGDVFRPAGRGVKKILKKLLGEERIPTALRDEIPIVCDAQGIVLVGGLGCDERVHIDENCRQVLVLEKE
ncbi:MAG: tRNA lysidine(34) synthetase TilS, partial [Oscillospiraceae bacterium]|nr:tRNA lysidine(34) synthetase TilS [Oscillospiraceae bacterium]